MTEPTIEKCVEWLEQVAARADEIVDAVGGAASPAVNTAHCARATIAYLRDHARLKAMLDDERVVRLPKQAPSFSWSETWPYVVEDDEALAIVAAWDEERK